MALVSRAALIPAPRSAVWSTVSDLAQFPEWYPAEVAVMVGEQATGVGATRTRDHGPAGRVDETVSVWLPNEQLWFAVAGRGAVRSADLGYVLADGDEEGSTRLEVIADYHLTMGPVGPVIDSVTMRDHITTMLESTLRGLKEFFTRSETMKGSSR